MEFLSTNTEQKSSLKSKPLTMAKQQLVYWTDYKASWVAIFILLLFLWLSYIPVMLRGKRSEIDNESPAVVQSRIISKDIINCDLRLTIEHFQVGLIFLLTAVIITFTLAAPPATSNTLAWIFTAFWIAIGVLVYFDRWLRLTALLQFIDIIIIIAMISNAFARSNSNAITT